MITNKKTLLLSAMIIIISFAGCSKETNDDKKPVTETAHKTMVRLSPASAMEIGLRTETTALKPFTGSIAIPAKVLANQDNEAQVGSLVPGRVYKVYAKVGDQVKAGQALMLMEGLQIGEIKAGFLKAKANLAYQKSTYERQKTLMEQKVGSQKSFLEAQAEYEKALAEYNAEDRKIHSIGLTDEEVTNNKNGHAEEHTSGTLAVKAPISGVIVERNVVIGQLLENTTIAFKIINSESVWIDGQMYEKDINRIAGKTEVSFTASAYPNETFKGRLDVIGQMIDEKTRTITVRASFSNPQGKLKPQLFGELKIPVDKNALALLIPAESVIKTDNADFVFIQKDDSLFEKRSVVVGAVQNDILEIKDGVTENERVVVKGAFYLKSELLKSELGEE